MYLAGKGIGPVIRVRRDFELNLDPLDFFDGIKCAYSTQSAEDIRSYIEKILSDDLAIQGLAEKDAVLIKGAFLPLNEITMKAFLK